MNANAMPAQPMLTMPAPILPIGKTARKARTPKAAPVDTAPAKKARKTSDPVARVHRAIMRDYLDKAAQAYLYGKVAAGDVWIAEAKARRAVLDALTH